MASTGVLYSDASHTVPLVPRLRHSGVLLGQVVGALQAMRDSQKQSNSHLAECDVPDRQAMDAICSEMRILAALEAVSWVGARAGRISDAASIPEALSASIQVIRTVSAQLYEAAPGCSRRLSELSVHLGSIALDSAAITHARFDFGRSNSESAALLDEVKLIAESKIKKQYPKLDFSGAWDA